jgi:hypothetical protein
MRQGRESVGAVKSTTAGESGIEIVPPLDSLFVEPPAEIDNSSLHAMPEINQSDARILQLDTKRRHLLTGSRKSTLGSCRITLDSTHDRRIDAVAVVSTASEQAIEFGLAGGGFGRPGLNVKQKWSQARQESLGLGPGEELRHGAGLYRPPRRNSHWSGLRNVEHADIA